MKRPLSNINVMYVKDSEPSFSLFPHDELIAICVVIFFESFLPGGCCCYNNHEGALLHISHKTSASDEGGRHQ